MTTTIGLIVAQLRQFCAEADDIERKMVESGPKRTPFLHEDDRDDVDARIKALEALLGLAIRMADDGDDVRVPDPLTPPDGLMGRLVAERADALRKQAELDEASIANQNDPKRKEALEVEMRKLGKYVFALEGGIAALRPKTSDRDEALVSAIRIRDELLDHGITEQNRCNVEMLARGLLEWHIATAGKSAEAVLGVR